MTRAGQAHAGLRPTPAGRKRLASAARNGDMGGCFRSTERPDGGEPWTA
jgi:hypothetical protein